MKKLLALLSIAVILLSSRAFSEQLFKEFYKQYELECGTSGGKLIFYTTRDPKSFNPIVSQESTTSTITSYFFEGLTETNPLTLEVEPDLASSWETEDGKVWIFNLRHDVYWSDGERFTADDVLFTFNDVIYNQAIPTGLRDILSIEGKTIAVEKIDDYTVRFILPEVFAPFLRAAGIGILPRHKYESLVKENKFTFAMGLDTKPSDIVGTGAFRLKEYFPGERVVLERNPYYFRKDSCGQKLPYLDEIIFIILSNQDTALLKFMEGEIDYYGLRTQDIAILGPLRKERNYSLYNAGPRFVTLFLVFNQNSGNNPETNKPFVRPYKLKWFRDKRFRQAIAYGIDREKIIDLIYNSLGIKLYSPVSPANTYFYNDAVKRYPFNRQRAEKLLAEMGFTDKDGDGILEDSSGNKLELTFFTNADAIERVQIASLIKKDLENLGLKIYFMPLDFNNLVRKLNATLDWELVLMGLGGGGLDPHFSKNVWSYKGNLHFWNKSGQPQDVYEQEVENIFNTAARTLDEAKRKELYGQWQEIISEELPLIYLPIAYSLYAVRDRFGNLYPTPLGGAFSETEHIYIRDQNK